MRVVKVTKDLSGCSVCLEHENLTFWVDVHVDKYGDACAEWNAYIFHLNNSRDVELRDFQDNIENADEAFSLAISALEERGFI